MFWLVVVSYWVHLVATVVWLGGMVLMAAVAWPAWRQGTLSANHWLDLQQRFWPWVNGSLVVLLLSGFWQMTNDSNYGGFLVLDGVWAWAILLKHVAFGGMVGISVYVQFGLYPAVARNRLLAEKRPTLAAAEQERLEKQEIGLLRLNLVCAMVVLFFTAVATAV